MSCYLLLLTSVKCSYLHLLCAVKLVDLSSTSNLVDVCLQETGSLGVNCIIDAGGKPPTHHTPHTHTPHTTHHTPHTHTPYTTHTHTTHTTHTHTPHTTHHTHTHHTPIQCLLTTFSLTFLWTLRHYGDNWRMSGTGTSTRIRHTLKQSPLLRENTSSLVA